MLDPDLARKGWKVLSSFGCCLCCVAFPVTRHPSGEWASVCTCACKLAAISVAKLAEHIACLLSLLVSSLETCRAFGAQRKLMLRLYSLLVLYWGRTGKLPKVSISQHTVTYPDCECSQFWGRIASYQERAKIR